jgi:hypothetical protein
MGTLTPLETAVLEKLVSGEKDSYRTLQKQICALRVTNRKMTGVGFFTRFSLPTEAPILRDEASFHISDVAAEIKGLENGAGFVLFIKNGKISMLEGFTYDEPWPSQITSFRLYYDGTSDRR